MIFRRAVQRYARTEDPETPFARAGQIWDDRIGSARVQAYHWRLMALGELLLCSGLSAALVWQSRQSHIVPYVVEVDRLGEARSVAPVAAQWTPNEAQVAWQLGRFIRDVRSVSLDPVVTRQNWLDAYAMSTEQAAHSLSDQARSSNPFADAGSRAVSVEIASVVRISDQSFEIKWLETQFERGALIGRSHWTGVVTIRLVAPRSADVLRRNPLGIYVNGVDWSREWSADEKPVSPAADTSSPAINQEDVP
ncbi:conjugal transfer protein TrbF [Sphingomonas oryzagri]